MSNISLVILALCFTAILCGVLIDVFKKHWYRYLSTLLCCFISALIVIMFFVSVNLRQGNIITYKTLSSHAYNIEDCSIQLKMTYSAGTSKYTTTRYLLCDDLSEDDLLDFMKIGYKSNSLSLVVISGTKEVYEKTLIRYTMSAINRKEIKKTYSRVNSLVNFVQSSDKIVIKRVTKVNKKCKWLGWNKTEVTVE